MNKTLIAAALVLLFGSHVQAAQETQNGQDERTELRAACQQEAKEVGLSDPQEIADYTQDCVAARSYSEEAPEGGAPAQGERD